MAIMELKLNKKHKFIIYKLSDDFKTIVIDTVDDSEDWEVFREKLINAETKSKTSEIFNICDNRVWWEKAQDMLSMTLSLICQAEKDQGTENSNPIFKIETQTLQE
ncbi:Cofilin [Golovinomyces cichoracearum]|uniref:Cofilin n=1 Tax=Golovinomyces cichoracearum TaxID=62708 RepID=A0A420IJF3_9PEZI|nr:Cofilin [Golovinomyces cichoracearum]